MEIVHSIDVVEHRSLSDITGMRMDLDAISDHGYTRYVHNYDTELLDKILKTALQLEGQATNRFLSLTHLRQAQIHIPEVDFLMRDPSRLEALSRLADCELEPYPIPTAAAHINYYRHNKPTIDFHTDGAAIVEIIPLSITGVSPDTSTLIYNGSIEQGRRELLHDDFMFRNRVSSVCQNVGMAVLFQGRRILHSAKIEIDTERVTLVLVLRSKREPWKDDNTLFRLLKDDEPDDVVDHWVNDVVNRQYPAFLAACEFAKTT